MVHPRRGTAAGPRRGAVALGSDADAIVSAKAQDGVQGDLFDVDDHQTSPIAAQREQLAALVEALLREIAAALAAAEVGDDQDHG